VFNSWPSGTTSPNENRPLKNVSDITLSRTGFMSAPKRRLCDPEVRLKFCMNW
jgi:hypothetical protein